MLSASEHTANRFAFKDIQMCVYFVYTDSELHRLRCGVLCMSNHLGQRMATAGNIAYNDLHRLHCVCDASGDLHRLLCGVLLHVIQV